MLRVLIPDLWRREGGRSAAAREERLALSVLVARHIWGDPTFAYAAERLSTVKYRSIMERMKSDESSRDEQKVEAKTRGRQRTRRG